MHTSCHARSVARSGASEREGTVPLGSSQAPSNRFVEILRIHRLIHRSGRSSFPKTPEFLSEAVLKLRPDASGRRLRRSQPGAARSGRGRARAGVHPRGRRLGQDDDDHAPDREPGPDRRVPADRDPRRHVHRQGRRRDAFPASAARRARRPGAHVPLGRARTAPALRRRRARADPAVEGADAPADSPLPAAAVQVPAARRPGRARSSGPRTGA